MKITFYSCYMNHHQLPVALELFNREDIEYHFVAKYPFNEERRKLGYVDMNKSYSFIVRYYEGEKEQTKSIVLAETSDVIVHDGTFLEEEKKALEKGNLVFRYSEHVFKKEPYFYFHLKTFYKILKTHIRAKDKSEIYLLCASAYRAVEAKLFNEYAQSYKWGYFPEFYSYEVDKLIKKKDDKCIKMLWCGRFLKWKNIDLVVPIAKYLNKKGIQFEITMIGEGEEKENIVNAVEKENLSRCIKFCSGTNYKEVRKYMEAAAIYLFLSNHEEGWGVVLNEAMNSGCAVVANKLAGSTPYLIKNNYNGVVFHDRNVKELERKIYLLCKNRVRRENLGRNAYLSIEKLWNPKVAAENLIVLCKTLQNQGENLIKIGPGSKS